MKSLLIPWTTTGGIASSALSLEFHPDTKSAIYNTTSSTKDGTPGVLMKFYMHSGFVYGESKEVVRTDDEYAADFTSDPAAISSWHLLTQTYDGTSTGSYRGDVYITYWCEFTVRKSPSIT